METNSCEYQLTSIGSVVCAQIPVIWEDISVKILMCLKLDVFLSQSCFYESCEADWDIL